jgi:hypothetical protein
MFSSSATLLSKLWQEKVELRGSAAYLSQSETVRSDEAKSWLLFIQRLFYEIPDKVVYSPKMLDALPGMREVICGLSLFNPHLSTPRQGSKSYERFSTRQKS